LEVSTAYADRKRSYARILAGDRDPSVSAVRERKERRQKAAVANVGNVSQRWA
jgi:hypothetical protein